MFDETLRRIRKEKGMTQEELAIKVHVARQTVSKWEKGLSIPDVDLLQRLSEALEVDLSELLGAQILKEENRNEIAQQLAKISEQLAIKNKRSNSIWKLVKGILIGIVILIIGYFLLAGLLSFTFHTRTESSGVSSEELRGEQNLISAWEQDQEDNILGKEIIYVKSSTDQISWR